LDGSDLGERVAMGDENGAGRPETYQIVIIDDHALFSTSLMMALRDLGHDARIVPVAGLGEFAAQTRGAQPGVVVLDLNLGVGADGRRINGYDWIGRLVRGGWPVLMVTGSEKASDAVAAIAEGAAGVVSKSSPLEELLDSVTLAARGESLINSDVRQEYEARHRLTRERQQLVDERLDRLTIREREVLEAIARGMHAAGIASQSHVSLATVRTQIRAILRKLEVTSQIEAIALLRQSSSM
jgi:DNA-binding NarL/FixJ family response regulator